MLIGIDGNEANEDNRVGVHQQAFEILWELHKLEDTNNEYLIYLKSPPKGDLPKENSRWKYKIIKGKRLWVLTSLTWELMKRPRPDVFFTPSHYLPIFTLIPKVCMITDLGYLEYSGQFKKYDYWQLKYWTAISLIVSKHIISISETTKKDIVRHYNIDPKKISVVYLGPNKIVTNYKNNFNIVRQILHKYRITKKFIIFISTLKPGKNVEGLVEAFSKIKNKDEYQLVVAGKKGWFYKTIFEKVKQFGLQGDVIFTDYLKEEDKPVLISSAKVLALPSFTEGFGIDVVNAFALGTPVVISNIPIMKEIAGKAGTYVDPFRSDSVKKGIEYVLNLRPKEYNMIKNKGFDELKKFSWRSSAAKINKILTTLQS